MTDTHDVDVARRSSGVVDRVGRRTGTVERTSRGPVEARRRPSVPWEILGIIAFTAWIAWPFVEPGGYVTDFDTFAYSGPNLEATYRAWGQGRFPWWESGAFGGTAFSANLQTATFYPLKVLFWPLGAPAAMGAMTATHLFVLAFGMRHLVRRTLHLAAPAGLVAAVVVVGAGSTMVRTVRFEQIAVMAWIPWLLVAVDAVMVARPGHRSRAVAGCAVVAALVVLSGHPQQVYLGAALTFVWTVGRALDHRARRADLSDPLWRGMARLGLAFVLGAGLAGVALAPAIPLFGAGSVPGEVLLHEASSETYVLDPDRAVAELLGDPWSPPEPLTRPTSEAPVFLGAAAIGLAAVGAMVALSRGGRSLHPLRATAGLLLASAVGAVLLAFGPDAGFYRTAAGVVPGLGQGRVPLRWIFIVTFVVAVLAGVGASALKDHLLTRRRAVVASIVVSVTLVAVAAAAPSLSGDATPLVTRLTWVLGLGIVAGAVVLAVRRRHDRASRNILGALAVGFVVLELGVAGMTSYGRELRRSESFETSSSDETTTFLAARGDRYLAVGASDANRSLTVGTRTLDGYDGGLWLTDSYVAAAQQVVDGDFEPLGRISEQIAPPLDGEALARLGVRYVVIDPHDHVVRAMGRPPANEAELARARQQLVPGWAGPALVDGAREVWENPRYQSEALIYPGDSGTVGVPATLERRAPDAIDVTTAQGAAGLLTVAEQAQPGWEVTIDGEPAELVDADGFALAVEVPPGPHDVQFRYRPPGLTLGLAATAISIAVVIGLALAASSPVRRVGDDVVRRARARSDRRS